LSPLPPTSFAPYALTKTHLSPDAAVFVGAIPLATSLVNHLADDESERQMNTITNINKLVATGVMAGALSFAALGLGSGVAAADSSTHSGTSSSSSSTSGEQSEPSRIPFPSQAAHAAAPSRKSMVSKPDCPFC
jgi:hypothetical protein